MMELIDHSKAKHVTGECLETCSDRGWRSPSCWKGRRGRDMIHLAGDIRDSLQLYLPAKPL